MVGKRCHHAGTHGMQESKVSLSLSSQREMFLFNSIQMQPVRHAGEYRKFKNERSNLRTSKFHQSNYKGLNRGQPFWKFCDIRPHKHTSYQFWNLSVQDPCGPDRSPRMAPALSLGNMGPVPDFNHDLGSAVTVLNQRMQQVFALRYWLKAPKLVCDCGLDYTTAVDSRMIATACIQASWENRAAMSLFGWLLAQ